MIQQMNQMQPGTGEEFSDSWPRYTCQDGAPIEYEIKLAQYGQVPANTIIRAFVDDSQQAAADGRCWRAITGCHMVDVGQRVEKYNVVGWREISKGT